MRTAPPDNHQLSKQVAEGLACAVAACETGNIESARIHCTSALCALMTLESRAIGWEPPKYGYQDRLLGNEKGWT